MRSLFYEDYSIGQSFKSSGRTITETDLTFFSMLSGDWNPIHADVEYAKTTRYGERVVHGVLGIALCTGMMHEMGIFETSAIAMVNLRNWLFKAPLLVGDTVHLVLTITELEPGKSGKSGRLGRRFELVNQKGIVVQEGESDLLVLTKSQAEGE